MPSLVFQVSWPALGIVLLVFGLAPGLALRLIVLAFPRDDPRRRELLGELYRVPWFERPFWVAGKLEVALFEGLPNRAARKRAQGRGAAIERAAEQGLLPGLNLRLRLHPEDVGYRGPTACAVAGITYRQLNYWAETGLVEPSVLAADGPGRLYSFRDVLLLKVVKRLLDTGVSLQQIRAGVHHLRDRGTLELPRITLMGDGTGVYGCTSPDEVVDLLAGGQGVFGIALGQIWQEVDGRLMELRGEPAAAEGAGQA